MSKALLYILISLFVVAYPAYFLVKKYTAKPAAQSTAGQDTPLRSPSSAGQADNPPTGEAGSTQITVPPAVPTNSKYNNPAFPVAEFSARITKKPFGIYITPQNSPISPERFTGYHTGTDIEYQDVTTDVPVYAIEDGTITVARTASGYGGVMILDCTLDKERSVLYGHIRPSSLPKVGAKVKKGQQIGLLGTGYSTETDGERRHLHFAVLSNNRIDLLGYVQTKSALSGWIDPTSIF